MRRVFTILNVNGIDETVLKNRHAYGITGVEFAYVLTTQLIRLE
jgi:hypothetical protein